ncbi:MAG: hypothetical protein V1658_03580, partial [Candidatus Micrarchaeota archaeon]
ILREMLHATSVDFVARAPAGKEVEELTRKEIIMALRRKVPVEQAETELKEQISDRENRYDFKKRFEKKREEGWYQKVMPAGSQPVKVVQQESQQPTEPRQESAPAQLVQEQLSPEDEAKVGFFRGQLKELEGSLKAKLYNADLQSIGEAPIREIIKVLSESEGVFGVVLDGIVTQRLLDLSEQKGVQFAVGIRAGNITRKPDKIKVVLGE